VGKFRGRRNHLDLGTNFLLQKSNSYGESKNLRRAMYDLLALLLLLPMSYFGGGGDFC